MRSSTARTAHCVASPALRPTAQGRRKGHGCKEYSHQCQALSLRDTSVQNELSTSYDADVVNAFFKGRPWLVAGRVLDVAKQGVSLFLKLKLGGKEVSLAGEISGVLSRAGPTFVKLGQTLSTREDLVGRDIARALADLQMAAPPFPDAVAMDIITAELGGLPAEIFGTFSQRYVAAASMGQVYKATLKSTGEEVAVKVQRPDLLGSIALDVYVLRLCLGAIRFLAKINSDVRSIADEVGAGLFAELDYAVEASQAKMFAEAHSHLPFTDAVRVFPEFSSKRVLTTLWVDGSSPNDLLLQCDAMSRDSPEYHALEARLVHMINLGIESSLTQLLLTGILHGDPHPGNLILTHDNRLVYLDFGLLTFVPPATREAMMGCLVHVALGSWRAMADDLDAMGFLKEKIDKDELATALEEEVSKVWPLAGSFGANSFLPDGSAQTGGALADRLADGRVRPELGLGQGLTFGRLAKAIIKLAIQFRFRLPPYYTLIVRSLCSLEGIALRVDPDFSIVNAAIPIILRRLLTDTRPGPVSLLRELLLEEDKRLRIGMLEGLLRNYSVEAGKGTASQTAASGVVLKQAGSPAEAYEGESQQTAVSAPGSNGIHHGAHQNGLSHAPGVHGSGDMTMWDRPSSFSNGSAMATSGQPHVAKPNLDSTNMPLQARAGHIKHTSELAQQSLGVSTISEIGLDDGAKAWPGDTGKSSVPAENGGSSDVIGLVVQMTLSAKAAGVRRVVLEASMKDLVQTIGGKEGASLRGQMVTLLSQFITWSSLPRWMALCTGVLVNGILSLLARLLRLGARRSKRQPKLINLRKGMWIKNVYLNRVALKRLHLGVLIALDRLWKESKWTTFCSIFLGMQIITAALLKRKQTAPVS